MTDKYDFILFENSHLAKNHKYDVVLIGNLLKKSGLKVAILDIYNEDNADIIEGLPVLHLPFSIPIPNDEWNIKPKSKVHSMLCLLRFLWQQHNYYKKVITYIEPLADRFYIGSYHVMMSCLLFRMSKPCYTWGLRSARMNNFMTHFKRNPVMAFRMLLLKYTFRRNPNQYLFVSNEIIRMEFEQLGIPHNRIVIREERCIETLGNPNYEEIDDTFNILTIGMLRSDKRIDYIINEFKQCHMSRWEYVLVGKSQGKYENIINQNIGDIENIKRVNKYLTYKDFNDYIKKSHYVVFADKKQKSSITNGTMLEALINYRPIIAPDYDPYRFYVNTYHIGILYNPNKPNDLTKAIQKAERLGCKTFYDNINAFLKTIKFDFVSKSLYSQIFTNNQL